MGYTTREMGYTLLLYNKLRYDNDHCNAYLLLVVIV